MENVVRDLLDQLRDKNVSLKLNHQQELEITVSHGKIPAELVEEIKKQKQEIIDYIKYSNLYTENEIELTTLAESYPVSSSQRSLWIVCQDLTASISYNIPSTVNLEGIEDIALLQEAITSVIDRHEILRTVFKQDEDGEIRQIVLSRNALNFKIEHKDFRKNGDANSEIEIFIALDSMKPFDLEEGPLLRIFLIQKTDDSFAFYYNMHHIITDGWSNEILEREVLSFYWAYKKNILPDLPKLRIQYKDYAAWEHSQLRSGKMEAHKKYWLENLAGELPSLNLPSNKKRPNIKTYNGKSLITRISPEKIVRLKALVQPVGGSLFMGLLSVLKIVLNKYTSEQDLIVGSVIAGREELDLHDQIGYYVKVLALRNQLHADDSFLSFFTKLRENTSKAYKHQNYPFEQLVIDLNQKKDPGRNPVYDFTVEYSVLKLDRYNEALNFEDITDLGVCTCKTDVEFHFYEFEDQVYFNVIYNSDIYASDMIRRFMSNLKELVSEVCNNPNEKLSEINYLSKVEKDQLLITFNDTKTNYPGDKTIVDLFEEQVLKTPDNVAVEFHDKSLTYRQLNDLSNQLGYYLIENYDIRTDDLVGIKLDRSENLIVVMLGILKSGGAYVPIDIAYPKERIAFIETDIKSKVVVDEAEMNLFYSGKDKYSTANLEKMMQPTDLAYVIYTSGTTGNPKGTLLEHKNVVRLFFTDRPLFDFNETDVWTMFHSYSFDFSVWEMYGALFYGGKVIVVPKIIAQNTPAFLELLKNRAVTVLNQTPSAFYNLIECEKLDDTKDLKIRYVIFGGEALNPFMLSGWYKKYPSIKLINMYGITETTVHVTYKEIGEKEINLTQSNIGKPIPTLSCFILDAFSQLVPIGVFGELYISGPGLARGYLNRPDLTSEKFLLNPFCEGELMYKTGDLGKWLDDGNIEYKGRIDDQVKIRGHRIELAEIEKNLLHVNSINQSVVIASEKNGAKYLIAYYVSEVVLSKKEIQAALSKMVPDYMLPSYYIELDAIPLTANGKVDKKTLPEVNETDLIKEEYAAPATQNEIVLASVWCEVLGYENIGINDSFYNLGGDSIKSILVISRLKQQGYTLKVEQILRNPVLEDLAKLLTHNTINTCQSEIEGDVLLTPIQSYFFENTLIPNKNHYNQSVLLQSSSAIDTDTLDQCIAALVKHHDVLRMRYTFENNSWKQYNAANSGKHYKINFYDLRDEQDERSTMLEIAEKAQSDFDIGSGILFQAVHFKLSDGDRLALIVHHLIIDGVSWRILLEDLSDLYLSSQAKKTLTLPLKSDSFQHWASSLKEYAQSDKMKQEFLYWDERSRVLIQDFPLDYKVSEKVCHLDAETGFTLDKVITEKLKTKVHGIFNTEINDILLAALGMAIKDIFGVEKCVIMLEGHGREEIIDNLNIGRTIGWFTSIYPFVLDISNSEGHELVAVKESLRSVPNKGIGYGILNYLDTKFENQLKPAIQFNYLGDFGGTVGKSEENNVFRFSLDTIGGAIAKENSNTDILLDVSGIMVLGELNLSIRYSTNCYSKATIERLNDSYRNYLESLVSNLSTADKRELTPSDLTFNKLSYLKLSEINKDDTVEDIYELSPLQQGLYYNWLVDPSNSMFFIQTSYSLKATGLDIELLKIAFNKLIDRYPTIRTSFNNSLGDTLLQIVHKKVNSEFSYEKLSDDRQDNEVIIKKIKEADIAEGFNLENPNLMRLKVLQANSDEYILIWSHHHILMDGWCVSILVNDFYRILNSLFNKQPLNLPPPAKYATYIKWLSELNKDLTLSYWKKYLSGIETVTDIPFKNNTAEIVGNSAEFKKEVLLLDGMQFQKIDIFNKNLNITWNTFLQGVWGYLLSKYNDTNDVVFGSVVSGRPGELEEVQNIVGLFSNTIPVRVKYNDDDSPATFLKRLHSEMLESTPHHYASLSEVQSQSILGMDLIKNLMVFENFFVQDTIEDEIDALYDGQGQTIVIEGVDFVDQSNYNFDITIMPSKSSLKLFFRYNSSIFDATIIQNLTCHFESIVAQFIEYENTSIHDITYLSSLEHDKVINEFNATDLDFPKNRTIVDLFEMQASATPDTVALFFEGKTLTYKELDIISNNLSCTLREDYGVRKGDFVGVQLYRSEWSVISFLGILKSGGVYVPVDHELPDDRKSFIFSDTGLKVLITETAFIFDLDFYDGPVFSLDVEFEPAQERAYEKQDIAADDLAYIIYTSGSTGNPKGVMIEHSGIANTITSQKDAIGMGDCKNSLQFASFSFDTSIWDIFNTLLSGSSLYILNEETRKDIKLFEAYVVENEIEIATLPPAFLKLLDISCLKNLKVLITAGESAIHDKVSEYLQYGTFYNSFGPTESSIACTGYKVEKGSTLSSANIPIGKPIDNVQVYVLDTFLNPCAIGVYGELYISGAGLARGYQNRPDLSSKSFVPNPFKEGMQMYKSGDLARWLPDGNLEYKGRLDTQVKIRGYRIELGEIENRLSEIDGIRQTVVIVSQDNDDKHLIAYYVADQPIDKNRIQSDLSKTLPVFMLPSYYVQLAFMPLTINGKIDKKALPQVLEKDLIKTSYVAPDNSKEIALASVWSEVLKYDNIGKKDNFYNLGGDSIKSLMVIFKLKELGYIVKIDHILQNPILEDLAKCIEKNETAALALEDQKKNEFYHKNWKIGDMIELSPNQKRFYKMDYSAISLRLTVPYLNLQTFEKDFIEFLSYLPNLTIRYEEINGVIFQRYLSADETKIEVLTNDLDLKEEELISQQAESFLFERPFKLLYGALIRIFIVPSVHKNEATVGISMHHSLSDAHTTGLIMKEMTTFFNEGEKCSFYYHPFHFIDFQQKYLNSTQGLTERKKWVDVLKSHDLSYADEHNGNGRHDCVEQKIVITGEEFAKIQELSHILNLPVSILFNTFYLMILKKVGEKNKKLYQVFVSAREQKIKDLPTDKILGVIDNSLIINYYDEDFELSQEYINTIYSKYLNGRKEQVIPYEILQEDLMNDCGIDLDSNTIGFYNFMSLDESISNRKTIDESVEIKYTKSTMKYDISLACLLFSDALSIQLVCRKNFYENKEKSVSLDKNLEEFLLGIKNLKSDLLTNLNN